MITNVVPLAIGAVTCVTFPGMRLPGTILQGILARTALTFLRIYLGAVFLLLAWPDVQESFTANASRFAIVVAWGELGVGICLILGVLTRLAAIGALLLSLMHMPAKGVWLWTLSSSDAAFACIAIALIFGAAGRTLGVDVVLAKRWPRSMLW